MVEILFKALADRNRIKIIAALLQKSEVCACQLQEFLQVSGATVSKHVSLLIQAGFVRSRKEGRWVLYHMASDNEKLTVLLKWVAVEIELDNALKHDLNNFSTIMKIDPEELCRAQRENSCCK
ncbi:MAG: metalloregulator ArsR/SmtB family transcription factor [Fibrobacterales bacterium]